MLATSTASEFDPVGMLAQERLHRVLPRLQPFHVRLKTVHARFEQRHARFEPIQAAVEAFAERRDLTAQLIAHLPLPMLQVEQQLHHHLQARFVGHAAPPNTL